MKGSSRRLVSLLLIAAASGCGDEGETEAPPVGGCAPGDYVAPDGSCAAPGLPADMACAPGEWLNGACVPAGVPPDGCGAGFVHDGDRGCEAVLPPTPCLAGSMAVPGETSCREIAPCPEGKWGDIPVEANTEYVDASYVGPSNGSAAQPWTTIEDGIDAAQPYAVVAVAAGSYVEELTIVRPLRLWGTCPSRVLLRGPGNLGVILVDGISAGGTEMHRIGVTSDGDAIIVRDAGNILLSEVWLHDNAGIGLGVRGFNGETVRVERSLIEHNNEYGILLGGGELTIDASVIRDTGVVGPLSGGVGLLSEGDGSENRVLIRGSLLERNASFGVLAAGSSADIERTVIRDTLPLGPEFTAGSGLLVTGDPPPGLRGNLALRTSIVERNTRTGVVLFDSDATIDATVVRDTAADETNVFGRGISATTLTDGSTLALTASLVERNHSGGVAFFGSTGTVHASVVRSVVPDREGRSRAVSAQAHSDTGRRSNLTITSSIAADTTEYGLLAINSDLTVDATLVQDIRANADGFYGRGIQVQDAPAGAAPAFATGTLRATLVERTVETGILFVGHTTGSVDACAVRDTAAGADGVLGDGIVSWSSEGLSTVSVTSTRVDRSARATLSSFGGAVTLRNSAFVCQAFDFAVEPWEGQPTVLEDLGGVTCGCPDPQPGCRAQSYALTPPPAVGGLE
jgi:hypothetical protein